MGVPVVITKPVNPMTLAEEVAEILSYTKLRSIAVAIKVRTDLTAEMTTYQ